MTNPLAIPALMTVLVSFFVFALWAVRKKKAKVDASPLSYSDLSSAHADPFGNFEMTVEDVFNIKGRGMVITGKIGTGSVKNGDVLTLHRKNGNSRQVTVKGIEMFRKLTNFAKAGDSVGLLLEELERTEVERGDRITS
jgi:translation elongation factor EF-Tu-like GTPase